MRLKFVLVSIIMATTSLFAQTTGYTVNDLINDPGLIFDVNLVEVLNVDSIIIAEVEAELAAQGVDSATIEKTKTIIEYVKQEADTANGGDGHVTLSEIDQQPGMNLDDMIDPLTTALVEPKIKEFYADPANEDLKKNLQLLSLFVDKLDGMATATAYSSAVASLYGYKGYDTFAISVGSLGAVKYPKMTASDREFFSESRTDAETDAYLRRKYGILEGDDDYTVMSKVLNSDGFALGAALQGSVINIGINADFLVDNLYLGAKFGTSSFYLNPNYGFTGSTFGNTTAEVKPDANYTPTDSPFNMNFNSWHYGVWASYQLMDHADMSFLVKWRGFSFNTGLLFTGNELSGDFYLNESETDPNLKTQLSYNYSSNVVTVPLEISTSLRLLGLVNFSLAAGVDLSFGSASLTTDIQNVRTGVYTVEEERKNYLSDQMYEAALQSAFNEAGVEFPLNKEYSPEFINPRITSGFGMGIGPFMTDFSVSYYYNSGFTFGVMAVLAW